MILLQKVNIFQRLKKNETFKFKQTFNDITILYKLKNISHQFLNVCINYTTYIYFLINLCRTIYS